MASFDGLSALLLNCSLQKRSADSHTRRLLSRVAGVMDAEGVDVELVHMLDHRIGFGMLKDTTDRGDAPGDEQDDWPMLQEKIMSADIFVMGTPIWLGVKSSLATLAIERMYAYSGDRNAKGQYLYYDKTGGCVVTGNEDGVKACSMEILYALSHIGYVVPPQADCGWIGEAGPGSSYGDAEEGTDVPAGYGNDFTNRNATIMAWNLMHTAKLLRDAGGFPVGGNVADTWRDSTNAADQDPDAWGT
ncbi:MAG: NAD(P)H-dependent oxidoreductase [Actinomycetota bacterium]